jgi:hypothetical protein
MSSNFGSNKYYVVAIGLIFFIAIYGSLRNSNHQKKSENNPADSTTTNINSPVADNSNHTDTTNSEKTESNNGPYFGFNAKGLYNVSEQITYTEDYLNKIPDSTRRELAIRVTGGTVSQTTDGNDWTNANIKQWSDLQNKYHIRLVYVVNGNDTPKNQADLIKRFLAFGAKFDFIEMMNEYYLPKFSEGDTKYSEVTKQVTAESYADEILPNYFDALDQFNLPYYIIFAPSRPGRDLAQSKTDDWNNTMIQEVIKKYPNRDLNATIHLYNTGENLASFDYDQIDRLRKLLPAGRHIAVTEAGIINPSLDYERIGSLTVTHYKNIISHLEQGDYLFDQILYNPSKNNNTADLNPTFKGITPKGQSILDFINNQL